MSVRVADHGTNELLSRLAESVRVKVGVIGQDAVEAHAESEDLTVVEVATKHEYGLGVPKRSFIRSYVDENEGRIKKYLRNVGKRIVGGGDPTESLDALGVVLVGEIRTRIANHISPKLSQARIDEKGSDTPLVDTGQLWSSIISTVDGERPIGADAYNALHGGKLPAVPK